MSDAQQAQDDEEVAIEELNEAWPVLTSAERLEGFRLLSRTAAEDLFLGLAPRDMAEIILELPASERRAWVRLLPPDDAADVLQEAPEAERATLLALLDEQTRREVSALMAYAEDQAGGLMSPRYIRVRPDVAVDEAITYIRRQAREKPEMLYYAFVLAPNEQLVGVVSLRELFVANPSQKVADVMTTSLVTVGEHDDQATVSKVFADNDLMAVPVVDAEGRLKGIVTVDDIVDVVQEEATEAIQKLGGQEALDGPYLRIGFGEMVRKRGGWLAALFLGEMLTATAMAVYEDAIARAVVLALFVPLIISSGGNSGSQASTLVIRAMALGEVSLRDWWRILRREVATGLALGSLLGSIGFLRIVLWQAIKPIYGEHYMLVAATVFTSLIGVVLFGTLAGSLLPLLLRRLGFDPASASAPFVATLVDVTGLLIYFSVATLVLRGTLL